MEARHRKKLTTFLKFGFSLLLVYFVFTKIDFKDVWGVLKQASWTPLAGAALFLLLSKAMASLRLNLYFHQIGVKLTQKSNAKLYLLGMFYNLFLPGGIGGDAYKGYAVKKKFQVRTKSVVGVLLLDRLSGMLLLVLYACILGLLVENEEFYEYKWLFGLTIVGGLLVSWIFNKKYFNYVYPVYWKSLGYSSIVQVFQLICVLFILRSLHIEDNILAYLFIFLISSAVAVLPVTIAGIGLRELVFLYGARWLGLDENTSIGISVLFFFITALVSFAGVYYHFKKPELEVIEE